MQKFRINALLESIKTFLLSQFLRYKLIFIGIFVLIFIRAAYKAFLVAMGSSLDMQWYPAIQYWGLGKFTESINPYIAYLNHDIFMAQGPNYAPLLYVLMYPFALMDFWSAKVAFGILSIVCFLMTLWVFYKNKTSLAFLLLMGVFAVVGYTFNNVIGNGQVALILGFCLALGYVYRGNPLILSLCLSLMLVKYSFGLPVLLGFFLAKYYKEVIFAILINLSAYALFAYQFDMGFLESLLLPLKVSTLATGIGPSDLMSLSRILNGNDFFFISNPFLYTILFICVLYVVACLYYTPQPSVIIVSSVLLGMVGIYHLGYDHYMFFVAILILKDAFRVNNFWMLFLIFLSLFFWFGNRIFNYIDLPEGFYWPMHMGVTFTSLMSVMILICLFGMLVSSRHLSDAEVLSKSK